MSHNFRFYSLIVSAILFIFLVFMNFSGYWTADRFQQILYFICMVSAIFAVGIETGKKIKTKS